ncbi:hypothetical protein JYU04_02005 [Dehalococcoides mccartyi]|nr:hypothetical protein [Dehalococcoides mccartyi]
MYGDLVAQAASAVQASIHIREIPFFVVSSKHPTTDKSSQIDANGADDQFAATGENNSPANLEAETSSHVSGDRLTSRTSLTIPDLAALAASNNSSVVFQQNAVRTLRTELNADAVLILDYTDAFGGKAVRAASGMSAVVIDSELWLPDQLSPVDVNSPVKFIDVDPSRFTSISAIGATAEYRSALALAIPAITGAAGMIIALCEKPVDFDESQIDRAKTIVSLLSLSASRSNALNVAERGESQLATSRMITRSIAPDPVSVDSSDNPKSLLAKISDLLLPFFDFDVIAVRVQLDDEFVTQEAISVNPKVASPAVRIRAVADSVSGPRPIEFRACDFSTALTNNPRFGGRFEQQDHNNDRVWKSAGFESLLVIPIISPTQTVVVLGSTRLSAFTPESVAVANRFVPALTAAFAGDNAAPVEAISHFENSQRIPEYVKSIASATELVSACGIIATQITNRTDASRVKIGFLDDESRRAELGFDTEPSDNFLGLEWITPEEIEQSIEIKSDIDTNGAQRVSSFRTAIRVIDRVIGYVEVTSNKEGFDDADIAQIKEITLACSQVVSTLRQLEQSEATLKKLEMLRRVTDQIRADRTNDPVSSPRTASLIRNLFDADWIYFGSVDHENDHSTTEITDGLNVPELAPGVRVSRRSLLIPSTLSVSSPVTVDLESAAPGQRAAGRWMYRAGLRSAICAPLRFDGIVSMMFMCASRKPTGFGSLEKKMLSSIVSELEVSIERSKLSPSKSNEQKGSAQLVIEQLGPNLEAILNNASALILTVDKDGIVTDVAGHGIESLKLVPERLIGRDFISYSRKIEGLEDALKQAIDGQSGRIEIEVFGTILDAWMEPNISPDGAPYSATVVVSDITDRVTAARAESALTSLKEEKERADKFIVSLSHEMKSPLTTVVALADLLGMNDRGNLHPDQIERIYVVQQNADRLSLLVDDFLNISKMETGTFESKPSKFQISELAYDLETSFDPIAKGQDHNIVVTAPDEHQFATADRELLRQAIMNLLTNASKYSPSNTNVSLDIWVDDNDLRITVTDEGPGIPHTERDRVFEPYSQLDNSDIPGHGMGLAIVRQIVELHHGKVWVEDGVGGGTSFAIWLPEAVSSS